MPTIQAKEFYEKLEGMKKDEQEMRHKQANNFQNQMLIMEEKIEKRFDKLEKMLESGFQKVEDTFATKTELANSLASTEIKIKNDSDRITKLESIFNKLVWIIIVGLLTLAGKAILEYIKTF